MGVDDAQKSVEVEGLVGVDSEQHFSEGLLVDEAEVGIVINSEDGDELAQEIMVALQLEVQDNLLKV